MAAAVGEREVEGVAARVLRDGDEARCARAGLEELAHAVAGALGRDHDHVVARAGLDLAEVDVEAVREENRGAGLEVRLDLALEDALLHMVGQEDRDEPGALYGGGNRLHRQPGFLGGRPRLAPEAQADLDVDAGVAQVQRVRVSLAAVADDGDLAVQELDVAFAVDRCCHDFLSLAENVLTPWARAPWTHGRGRCGRCAQAP